MKKLMFILLVTGFVAAIAVNPGLSGEISVTEVEVKGGSARIVINDVIEINEIELKEDVVEFPVYISNSGKVFTQIRFLTEEAKRTVVDAILNKKPSSELIRKINYKVTKMSPYNKKGSSLKAFAAVTFNGVLEVECKVTESSYTKGKYKISWPSRPPVKNKGEKKWLNQVSIINKKVKSIVEREILNEFNKMGPGGSNMTDMKVDIKEGLLDSPMTVTDVKVEKVGGKKDLIAIAQVDLNYSFRIKDIKVYKRKGQIFLEFPVYVSASGKEYTQIKLFSRKLRSKIKRAVTTGEPSQDESNKLGFEITKFEEFWKDSTLKYFCAVTLNGAVEIECKILDSPKYNAFVGWASSKEGERYVDKIIPCNLEVKNVIEAALLKRYRKVKGK